MITREEVESFSGFAYNSIYYMEIMELGGRKPLLIGHKPLDAVLVQVTMLDTLKMNYQVVSAAPVDEEP